MTDIGGITAEQLRSYIERVERLEAEKAEIAEHIKQVMAEAKANGFDPAIKPHLAEAKANGFDPAIKPHLAEAKANGFDTAIMREVLRLRKMAAQDRAERESLLDLYLRALGMEGGQ
jgi:uncharacterized protein (UPF0335 family)